VDETATLIGNSPAHVRKLIRDGWLDHIREGRRLWVHPDAAADRARLNQLRKERGGQWTIDGWKHKAPNLLPNALKGRPNPPARTDFSTVPLHPKEIWITGHLAADYLGIAYVSFHALAKRRGVVAKTRKELCLQPGEGQGKRPISKLYALSHIHLLMDERDALASWRNYTPAEWRQYHSWRPPRNADIDDFPANDTRITVPEAAHILGCSIATVYAHIRRGRLFAWQKTPGKQGSRIYLSLMQVTRYANIPERAGIQVADPEKQEYDRNFLHKCRIDPETKRKSGDYQHRDYGDCYTTFQTAAYLGITPGAVRALVRNRRLQAHHRPLKPGENINHKWLFFLKEDVHALAADPTYQKHRAAQRLAQQRKEEREYQEQNPPEVTEEEYQASQQAKRRARAEQNDPNLTNHATRSGW
jgi:DNA-binding CsgD family transcriptional regulator